MEARQAVIGRFDVEAVIGQRLFKRRRENAGVVRWSVQEKEAPALLLGESAKEVSFGDQNFPRQAVKIKRLPAGSRVEAVKERKWRFREKGITAVAGAAVRDREFSFPAESVDSDQNERGGGDQGNAQEAASGTVAGVSETK